MRFMFPLLLALFISAAHAQIPFTTLTSTEIIDTNAIFSVTGVEFNGITTEASPARLYYSFFHPYAAVLREDKGKPEMVANSSAAAMCSVELLGNGHFGTNDIQWLGSSKEKIFARYAKLPTTEEEKNNFLLAKEGEFFTNEMAANIKVRKNPEFTYVSWRKRAPAPPEPTYVDNYLATRIDLSPSGKISYIALSSFALKPESERGKLLSSDYKGTHVIHKDGLDAVFEAPNMTFHSSLKEVVKIPQVNDPVSGNTTIMGNIDYKKDKTKENSHLREFVIFTFDNKGNLLKRYKHDSEVNLEIDDVYAIKGKNLAPDVDEVTKAIFVTKGRGNNAQLRRIFIVDLKTGELLKTSDFELLHPQTELIKKRYLKDGRIELTYLHTVEGKRGFSFVILGEGGVENILPFDIDSPEMTTMSLPNESLPSPTLSALYTFETTDGGFFNVEKFTSTSGTSASDIKTQTHGYALCHYAPGGALQSFKGLEGRNFTDFEVRWMDEKSAFLVAYLDIPELDIKKPMRFLKLNLETGTAEWINLPDGIRFANMEGIFFDIEERRFYLAGQAAQGKGLRLSVGKL